MWTDNFFSYHTVAAGGCGETNNCRPIRSNEQLDLIDGAIVYRRLYFTTVFFLSFTYNNTIAYSILAIGIFFFFFFILSQGNVTCLPDLLVNK